jgi:hypothetical protein
MDGILPYTVIFGFDFFGPNPSEPDPYSPLVNTRKFNVKVVVVQQKWRI